MGRVHQASMDLGTSFGLLKNGPRIPLVHGWTVDPTSIHPDLRPEKRKRRDTAIYAGANRPNNEL